MGSSNTWSRCDGEVSTNIWPSRVSIMIVGKVGIGEIVACSLGCENIYAFINIYLFRPIDLWKIAPYFLSLHRVSEFGLQPHNELQRPASSFPVKHIYWTISEAAEGRPTQNFRLTYFGLIMNTGRCKHSWTSLNLMMPLFRSPSKPPTGASIMLLYYIF